MRGSMRVNSLAEHEMLAIAELMQALSAPSRLRLLYALRHGEKGVGDAGGGDRA